MPTGSSSQMAQAMPGQPVPPPQGQWGGNITQGTTGQNAPQSQPGQGGLQQALAGLQLFQQMKQAADPQGNVPPGTGPGIQTQGGIPLNVGLGSYAQTAKQLGLIK